MPAVTYLPAKPEKSWPAHTWTDAWDDLDQQNAWEDAEGDPERAEQREILHASYLTHGSDADYVYAIIMAAKSLWSDFGPKEFAALDSQYQTVYDGWGEVIADELTERESPVEFDHLNEDGIEYMKHLIRRDSEIWVDSGAKDNQFGDCCQLYLFEKPTTL